MLRNRYVLAGIGVLLLIVVSYNVSFFRSRRGGVPPSGPPPPSAEKAGTPQQGIAGNYVPAWKRDPFWYPEGALRGRPAGPRRDEPRAASEGLRLEGTTAREGKGYALINGRVYGVGDRVADYDVVEITGRSVTLRGTSGTRTLDILNDAVKKE